MEQAILGNDLNKLQEVLRLRHHQRDELKCQKEEELVCKLYDHYCFFTFVKSLSSIVSRQDALPSNPLEFFIFFPCTLLSLC